MLAGGGGWWRVVAGDDGWWVVVGGGGGELENDPDCVLVCFQKRGVGRQCAGLPSMFWIACCSSLCLCGV